MAKAGKCAVNTNIHFYVSFANVMRVNNILKNEQISSIHNVHTTHDISDSQRRATVSKTLAAEKHSVHLYFQKVSRL